MLGVPQAVSGLQIAWLDGGAQGHHPPRQMAEFSTPAPASPGFPRQPQLDS